MALTNFKKDDILEGKSDLLCSIDGCRNLWSVRIEGSLPKCSHHQWQQPKHGNTKTYQQHLADKNKPTDKTVGAWYDKGQW